MRAALYARISRDDAGERLGVRRQAEDCLALIERRGWSLTHQYIDNDVSAYSGRNRPEYQRMINDLEGSRFEMIVAWAPERLHRSPRELEDFIELIERTGVGVETIKAGAWDVSTSHGRLVARMLGAVSRAESERTGERVSRAHRQAQRSGMWRGPIPFGMRPSQVPGQPEPDERNAVVVQEIFDRILIGDALTRIARDLNDRGIRPARGLLWTHTGVARLVASPALGGLVRADGEIQTATFLGIVDSGTWHSVQAAIRRRPRGEVRRPREKLSLLGGLLRCAEHDFVCTGGGASHAATYVAGMPGMCFVSITRAAADLITAELVIERLGMPDALAVLQPRADDDQLELEARKLRRRREEITGLLADGLLAGTSARERLTTITERLREIEDLQIPSPFASQTLVDPRATWNQWTMPQRREVLKILFERITLQHVGPRHGPRADPTRVGFEWRGTSNS